MVEKLDKINSIKSQFYESLGTKDLKVIAGAVKTCLARCISLEEEAKNEDNLLRLMIELSKFFKNEFDFYKKMFEQGFFKLNPKFYNVWRKSTLDSIEIERIESLKQTNCNSKAKQSFSLFTKLSSFLLAFKKEISSEEFRAALYVNKPSEILYDRSFIDNFAKNHTSYLDRLKILSEKEEVLEETVNKTLLTIKPLPPGATPTVNTKEAVGFIEQLVHRPVFDSSDEESQDFFTRVPQAKEEHSLHKSITINDIWESPSKSGEPLVIANQAHNQIVLKPVAPGYDKTQPSTLTSGCVTHCTDNFSSEKHIFSSHMLAKPVVVTPFANFKKRFLEQDPVNNVPLKNNVIDKHDLVHFSDDTSQINFFSLLGSGQTSTPRPPHVCLFDHLGLNRLYSHIFLYIVYFYFIIFAFSFHPALSVFHLNT